MTDLVLISLSAHCIGHTTMCSRGDGGKQCILVGQHSALKTISHWEPRDHQSLKFKVGVLCSIQQSGSYWDRSSALSLMGVEPT